MKYSFLLFTFLFCLMSFSQERDSTQTVFREGRWLTGLSGSISSTRVKLDNSNSETSSNNYGINIQTGKFIKDRWLVGGRFQANKISSGGNVEQNTETLFIGPYSNYYFNRGTSGSLFSSVALGYTRFRNKTLLTQSESNIQEFSEGGGLGAILGVGYSYTITDSVAFDLGVNLNLFWVNVDQESSLNNTTTNTNVSSNDISFSFGFNVILDKFFF